jgi:acyl-CoA thioesterase I
VLLPPSKVKIGRDLLPALCVLAAVVGLFPANCQAQESHAAMPPQASLTNPAPISSPKSVPLQRVSDALRAIRTVRILAIGSSSTAGVGATSPSRTYVARLETDLEDAIKGTDFEVVAHGLSGEIAQGAADRMKREVEDVKPDLVIWQVGTNDATRRVALDGFKNCVRNTLAWLQDQKIDVILINPQYGETLVKDAYYEEVVTAIAEIARETQVPLVDRFDAMRKLQRERGAHFDLSADGLHMNDEGYRHLAKHVAATIIAALPPASAGNLAVARQ